MLLSNIFIHPVLALDDSSEDLTRQMSDKQMEFNDPIEITIANKTSTQNVYGLFNNPYDYSVNWTYIYNAPVIINIENSNLSSFSLIAGSEWDEYIFNNSVTVNVTNSTIKNYSGLRDMRNYYTGNYEEKVNSVQVHGTYTINLNNTKVTERFNAGVYKGSVYQGGGNHIPTDMMRAVVDGKTIINVTNKSEIGTMYCGHYLTQSEVDSAGMIEYSMGDIDVTLDDSIVLDFGAAYSNYLMKNYANIDGDVSVNIKNGTKIRNGLSAYPVMSSTYLSGKVTGTTSLTLDDANTFGTLAGFDEIHLGYDFITTSKFIPPPSGHSQVFLNEPDKWDDGSPLIFVWTNNVNLVGEPMIQQGWTDTNMSIEYDELPSWEAWFLIKDQGYTVKFVTNGGTPIANKQVSPGMSLSAPVSTLEGYQLEGWYKDSALQNAWDFAIDKVNSNMTLYAKWTPNNYEVLFDENGGSGTMNNQLIIYGQKVPLSKNVFTRTGYQFAGWSKTADGALEFADEAEAKNLTLNASITLYAVWQPNTYRIVYSANGGSGEMPAQNMLYDKKGKLSKNTFIRDGWVFIGWGITVDGTMHFVEEQTILNLSDGPDFVLYALWKKIESTSPDPAPQEPPTPPIPPSNNPQTKDSSNMVNWIVLASVSGGGLFGSMQYKKRKQCKTKR